MAQAAEQDEFDEQAAATAALSGYHATKDRDVEDQREYRMVPRGTPATLGILGFELAQKGKAAIFAKLSVDAPVEYADGGSNFSIRLSLNPVVGTKEDGTEKAGSGWDMTVRELAYIYAAVNQCSAAEGKAETTDCVLTDFPHLDPDDVPAFHAALVDNLNEKLKGQQFKTKGIGIKVGGPTGKKKDDGTDDKYRDQQTVGTYDYPKAAKK
jgi:hypothetical protein